MGMSDKKILKLLDGYEAKLINLKQDPHYGMTNGLAKIHHAEGMIPKMRVFLNEGRREKAFRWLGFLQGVFWMLDTYTVEQLANHSRPTKNDLREEHPIHSFDAFGCAECSKATASSMASQRACVFSKEYLDAPLDEFPIT